MVYLHCNSGSRIEALGYADYVLNNGMHYFSFDFSGSGISDGEYISLGVHETEDLAVIIKHIREKLGISQIVLWGRSMGAVTALRYAANDKKINGLIIDSPFSSLHKLALEMGEEKTSIPGILLPPILKIVEQTIKEKGGFEFKSLELVNYARNSNVPCVFITSKEDSFVKSQHVEKLHDLYAGKKRILYVGGDHNNERDHEFLTKISKIILDMITQKKVSGLILNEVKTHNKFTFYEQENNHPAKTLKEDIENHKLINLQNILDTNKEIAKKMVLNKKKESFGRLDTEVLYEEAPQISIHNHNKTSISSAFRLKDKMQSLIHNSQPSFHDFQNGNSINNKAEYAYVSGSFKNYNDPNRVLKDFHPKSPYTPYTKNITNVPYKKEKNISFYQKVSEYENDKNENNHFLKNIIPQIQINNLSYSNPIDLKNEINLKTKKKSHNFTGENIINDSSPNSKSFTTRNRQFL